PALPTPVSGIGAEPGPRYTPPFAIDPSRPNRLFSGYDQVFASDDDGNNWQPSLQTTLAGGRIAIPPLPTSNFNPQTGGPVFMDALATGRQTHIAFTLASGIIFFDGAGVFAATESGAVLDAASD